MSLDISPPFGEEFVKTLQKTILNTKIFPFKPKTLAAPPILSRGWLIPALLHIDLFTWQRWKYWVDCEEQGRLVDRPIPQIAWCSDSHDSPAFKMLKACLDEIPLYGGWQGRNKWDYIDYLLDWLLFALGYGDQTQLPTEPIDCEGASNRLYQVFCLEAMLAWPYDYWGNLLAENKHGEDLGFCPTPMDVTYLLFSHLRLPNTSFSLTVPFYDPCIGTGRLLLVASNYTVDLYGQEVSRTCIKATQVNGYLYAPWLVKPFTFLHSESEAEVGAHPANGKGQCWIVLPPLIERGSGEVPAVTFEEVFRALPADSRSVMSLPVLTDTTTCGG